MLVIEYIKNIPGKDFLLYYIIFVAITILLLYLYQRKKDKIPFQLIPEPTLFSPVELAYLKDGIRGVINTGLIDLWKKNLIEIDFSSTVNLPVRLKPAGETEMSDFEKFFYKHVDKYQDARLLFYKQSKEELEEFIQPEIKRLKEAGLISGDTLRYDPTIVLVVLFVLLIGFIKLTLGILNHKPVGFLLMILIFIPILVYKIFIQQSSPVTPLGKALLEKAEKRFEWLKEPGFSGQLPQADNLTYGVAVFGLLPFIETGLLGADAVYIQELAQRHQTGTGGNSYWGGCGAGCGAGCGGGCGGCGGGCGGCGGCGA